MIRHWMDRLHNWMSWLQQMHKDELISAINDLIDKGYHNSDKSQIIQLYGLAFPLDDRVNATCEDCIRKCFQKLQWAQSKNFSNIKMATTKLSSENIQDVKSARKFSFAPAYKGKGGKDSKQITIPRFKIKNLTEDRLTDELGEKLFNDPLTNKYVVKNEEK